MSIGLICEFNPFHYGHQYILNQIRHSGEPVICIMSGPFVQRGEPACASKYARTKVALNCGADVVIELPVRFAVSAAKNFALGGVEVLKNIKGVSALAFGVECETELLFEISEAKRSPKVDERICEELSKGVSYPSAVASALTSVNKAYGEALIKPNNVLALEYIDALEGSGITPMPIMRVGSSYNDVNLCGKFASATAIRNAISVGDANVSAYLPENMLKECKFVDLPLMKKLIHYSLLRRDLDELRDLPDVESGFEYAIFDATRANDLDEIFAKLKSKRYTYARLKRICLYSLLGINKQIMSDITNIKTRVLGIKKEHKSFLSNLSPNIITRNSDADKSFTSDKSVQIDSFAQDVYALLTASAPNQYYSVPMIVV